MEHKPDMNEIDENLDILKKAAKKVRAPKLSEEILISAISASSKSSIRERLSLLKPQQRFSLAGVAAAVVVGLAITPLLQPATKPDGFHLTLGSQKAGTNNPSLTAATGAQAQLDLSAAELSDAASYGPMIGAPWLDKNYFLASTKISDHAGSGTVYRVENLGDTDSLTKALARYFGLNEKLISKETGARSDSAQGNYHVGNYLDGGVSLNTYDYGSLQFSYYDSSAWAQGPCLHTEQAKVPVDIYGNPTKESDPSNTSKSYCTVFEQLTPDFPSDKVAALQVVRLAKMVGLEIEPEDVAINRTKDYLSASLRLRAGSDETSYSWYVNWGNTGKIQNAAGNAVRFAPVANVQTVSALDAVSRMTDGRWYASMSSTHYRFPTEHWNEKFETVKPKEPIEPSRRSRIVVEMAESVAVTVVDSSGQEWIVPGYAMYQDRGINAIVAVEDGVIDLPKDWPLLPSDFGQVIY